MLLVKNQRNQLLAPLQSVSGIVEKRHTSPILSNVLLERKEGQLMFLATDVEIQITNSTVTNDEAESTFAITVGARKLQDILRTLPENAEVSLIFNDRKLQLRAGKSRFSLQTLPAEDFPRISSENSHTRQITVTQKQFRQLIGKTQYAMAFQDVRYYLNGLLMIFDNAELKAVATDGHRLAYASMLLDNNEEESSHHELIIPRKTIIELNRLLTDSDEPLQIYLSQNQIRFDFGTISLVSKLIDGKFPDYERVIPATLNNTVVLNRAELLQSMIRAAILTSEKFRGVRLVLSTSSLKIISVNAEQEEAQEEIEVNFNGDLVDVAFNVSYLLDLLNNTSVENIEWGFNDGNSSSLLMIPGQKDFKYVVMPMRI